MHSRDRFNRHSTRKWNATARLFIAVGGPRLGSLLKTIAYTLNTQYTRLSEQK